MSESLLFVGLRYLAVGVAAFGVFITLRRGSKRAALGLTIALALSTWATSVWSLERPYGLVPDRAGVFELALATSGAVAPGLGEAFVVDLGNPRPFWGLFWSAVTGSTPERIYWLYPMLAPAAILALPILLYLFHTRDRDSHWQGLAVVFVACVASSPPLDVFRPYGLFFQGWFLESPHRGATLAACFLTFNLYWHGSGWQRALSGLLLGSVAWMDPLVFLWALGSLVIAILAERELSKAPRLAHLLPGVLVALPQLLAFTRGELLGLLPRRLEVFQYRAAFLDPFAAALDMREVFFFAVVGTIVLWKPPRRIARALLAMLASAFLLWGGASVAYRFTPFVGADTTFHLVRFCTGMVAGVGAYRSGQWLLERLDARNRLLERFRGSAAAWMGMGGANPEPLAFCLVVVALLPSSIAFIWNPARMDLDYYTYRKALAPDVVALRDWFVENSSPAAIVLTGEVTGEWVAALTGRRVIYGDRILPSEIRRERRRMIRGLFQSEDPGAMRQAFADTGADWLVWDDGLREVYWNFDTSRFESSGVFEKVAEIESEYAIYRLASENSAPGAR